jgi:hypothetical protein
VSLFFGFPGFAFFKGLRFSRVCIFQGFAFFKGLRFSRVCVFQGFAFFKILRFSIGPYAAESRHGSFVLTVGFVFVFREEYRTF